MPELQACNRSLPSALPALATLVSLSLGLAAVSNARAHKAPAFEQVGTASWYGPRFHGKKTANGEVFNQNKLTAAHRTLPLVLLCQIKILASDHVGKYNVMC